MAVALGYGGLANTNGARSFAGKVEAVGGVKGNIPKMGYFQYSIRGMRSVVLFLLGV